MNVFKSTLVVVIATFALMASMATSFALQRNLSGPYGEETGSLRVTPETFYNGQSVSIMANFPSGHYYINLLRETSPGSGEFEGIGSEETNRYGNAYFNNLDIEAPTRIYAQTEVPMDVGWHTGIRTIGPTPVDPTGPASASLSVSPNTFYKGQVISLAANFPSGQFTVTFFQETAPGSDHYEAVGTDESNRYGNAYLSRYKVVDGPRKVFALTEGDRYTTVKSLVPKTVDPSGPVVGRLSADPATFYSGRKVTLAANFPSGSFVVRFFKETVPGTGTYDLIGADASNSYGNAYLTNYPVHGNQAIFAQTQDGRRTQLAGFVPKMPFVDGSATGELSTNPRDFSIGDRVTLQAGFLYRCRHERVNFFRYSADGFTYLGSARADDIRGTRSANAYLRDFKVNQDMKVIAVTDTPCYEGGEVEQTDSDYLP